jgi:hypothetical protein
MIAGFLIGLGIMFVLSLFEKEDKRDSTNPYL